MKYSINELEALAAPIVSKDSLFKLFSIPLDELKALIDVFGKLAKEQQKETYRMTDVCPVCGRSNYMLYGGGSILCNSDTAGASISIDKSCADTHAIYAK